MLYKLGRIAYETRKFCYINLYIILLHVRICVEPRGGCLRNIDVPIYIYCGNRQSVFMPVFVR